MRAGTAALLFAFGLDQLTKWLIAAVVMQPPRVITITPFFNLTFGRNSGISFGLFAGGAEAGRWALTAVALGIVVGLLVWLSRAERRWLAAALGLVTGGALGNILDRIRHGAVTDFLDFHLAGWHWPAFNLADSAIFMGAAFLLLDGLLDGRRAARRADSDLEAGSTARLNSNGS